MPRSMPTDSPETLDLDILLMDYRPVEDDQTTKYDCDWGTIAAGKEDREQGEERRKKETGKSLAQKGSETAGSASRKDERRANRHARTDIASANDAARTN